MQYVRRNQDTLGMAEDTMGGDQPIVPDGVPNPGTSANTGDRTGNQETNDNEVTTPGNEGDKVSPDKDDDNNNDNHNDDQDGDNKDSANKDSPKKNNGQKMGDRDGARVIRMVLVVWVTMQVEAEGFLMNPNYVGLMYQ